jgi:formiminotetrahydrofolate cyclodeaminase
VAASDTLLDLPVAELLEQLASEAPAPGGGAVSALSAAMAAGLIAMVARASPDWPGANGSEAQALALRTRLAPLAAENAAAYEGAIAALALPESMAPDARGLAIGTALGRAAETPLRIAAAAADVALLAAHAAEYGEAALRPDAAAAALLAEGAARAACHLVEINLTTTDTDQRVLSAQAFVRTAADGATRALESARAAP